MFSIRSFALAFVCLSATAQATYIPEKRALAEVITSCRNPKQVAITFVSGNTVLFFLHTFQALSRFQDDGPWIWRYGVMFLVIHHLITTEMINSSKVSQMLKNAGAKGTFFVST